MRKVLVDENLPRGLLVALGCPCLHATEIGGQVTDEKLWSHARDHGFVILTKDADFFNQLAVHGAPPKVVWVRTGNMRRADLEATIAKLWPDVDRLLADADLIEIHQDRIEAIKFD